MMRARNSASVYIGELDSRITTRDIRDAFSQYGRIIQVDVKGNNDKFKYAFVDFEQAHYAEKCVGRSVRILGKPYNVSFSRSSSNHSSNNYSRGPTATKTDYGIEIRNMPRSGSWQDLKDFFRPVCEVISSQKIDDYTGQVFCRSHEDVENAVRRLDRSRFVSHR